MNLTLMLFLLFLLTIEMQKSWTGAEETQTETESRNGDADANQLSRNNSESIYENSTFGTKLDDSRLYEGKYDKDVQDQSLKWTGYLSDKAKLNFNHAFDNFKLNVSSKKENEGNNFPPVELPNLNNSLAKWALHHEQNSSFQNELENSNDNTLQDEEKIFEWKSREEAYRITSPEEFPYAVLLVLYEKQKIKGICTGSILTDEWVLTASHCLGNVDIVLVYAGGNSLQEINEFVKNKPLPKTSQLRQSAQMIMHPLYKESTGDCDVGLVKVDLKFSMTKYVGVVHLTTTPWRRSYHTYTTCTLTGFGVVQIGEKRNDDARRKTHRLEAKSPCICSFRLQILFGSKVASRYICTKPKQDYGVCPGDSGGGLICGGVLRGVAMQLIKLRDTNFCDMSLLSPMQCGSKNTLSVFQYPHRPRSLQLRGHATFCKSSLLRHNTLRRIGPAEYKDHYKTVAWISTKLDLLTDTCPFLPWINKHVHLLNDSKISKKCRFTSKSPRVHSSEFLLLFSNLAFVVIKMFPL